MDIGFVKVCTMQMRTVDVGGCRGVRERKDGG